MSTDILDDASARTRIDPSGMLESITGLPSQCRDAWAAGQALDLPPDYQDIDRIVILGMGGSAIGGDFFRVLLQRESGVPVFNVRAYDLPAFVGERTLVIASSYSGNTEETLSAFDQALGMPCEKLAITSGGKLLTTARANGVPTFSYEFKGEPRAAVGWGLMPLLRVGEKLGLMQGVERDVEEAIAVLGGLREEWAASLHSSRNAAKQMALRLRERLPVVYGAGTLIEVARRWKTQLNESAKTWAFCEEMPEAQHNAIVALGLPREVAATMTAVCLRSATLDHPRVRLRYDFSDRLMADAGLPHESVWARGDSALAQMLSLTMLGDYVSAYLALLYGIDPTPTAVIDDLKRLLLRH